MNTTRVAQILGVANIFIGLVNAASVNVLIGLVMAIALYLDRS